LHNTSYQNYEIIIANDNSTDSTEKILAEYKENHKVKTFKSGGLGTARARNMCFRFSHGDLIVCSDAHITVPTNWLENILEQYKETNFEIISVPMKPDPKGVGEVGSVGYGQTLNRNLFTVWNSKTPELSNEVGIVPGGFAIYKRSVFKDLGGYDDGFNTWGYEDVELSIKSWLMGYKSELSTNLVIEHFFRVSAPFNLQYTDYLYNIIRTALLHFSQPRIEKTKFILEARISKSYTNPRSEIEKIVSALQKTDVMKKRELYFAKRKYSDDWFF
jgi:glycosyltransferase involved in cell wall biosynthesis